MENSISRQNVNVNVRAVVTDPNVTVQYKTKVLQKNVVEGVNTLTPAMISEANTKYIIKYDYTLSDNITVPANCVLEFDGGSISGEHTLTGNNTDINAGLVKIFNTDVTLAGTWNVAEAYPEWFGADVNGNTELTSIVIKCLFFDKVCFTQKGRYLINNTITLRDSNQTIQISCKSELYKTDNGDLPMFHIISKTNTICGDGGKGLIYSSVPTPNGIIALGDLGDYVLSTNGSIYYNKINQLVIKGTSTSGDNTQSVAISYISGPLSSENVGRYYNSFTNLVVTHNNIGIRLKGDSNANFFRDITFVSIGVRTSDAGDNNGSHETDCAILLEQYDDPLMFVTENMFTQIFHTSSANAVTFYFRGAVQYNIITNSQSEVGGHGAFLKQSGTRCVENIIKNIVSLNYYEFILEDRNEFIYNNFIDANTYKYLIVRSTLDEPRTVIKNNEINVECANVIERLGKSPKYYGTKYYTLLDVVHNFKGKPGVIEIDFNLIGRATLADACSGITGKMKIYSQQSGGYIDKVDYSELNVINAFTLCKPIEISDTEFLIVIQTYPSNSSLYTQLEGSIKLIGSSVYSYTAFGNEYTSDGSNIVPVYLYKRGPSHIRPNFPSNGQQYIDTTISPSRPIWWNGSAWVDATGTTV